MKILANDGISDDAILKLKESGYKVVTEKVNQSDLIDEINNNNYEIILVRSATTIRKEVIDSCKSIKLLGRGGVGMDNIDVDYAIQKGIKVINTPAASSQSVAELVMGSLFSISRFIHKSAKEMENGDFNKLKKNYSNGVELRGKTLGIIGFGRIGQSLASYALSIGMKVVALDVAERYVDIDIIDSTIEIGVETDLDLFLPKCDYISVHIPKQSDGSSVINEREFNLMKDGVRLVNAARGGVINEIDLIKALDNGKVAAVALDVFENEPNPSKELLSHPNILTTPHIGAATMEAQDRIGIELADLIIKEFGIQIKKTHYI